MFIRSNFRKSINNQAYRYISATFSFTHTYSTTEHNRFTRMLDKYTIVADNQEIQKPLTDDRSYRFIKLNSNDLHVLLIHDPSTDKSAASLDVNVGSFADKKYGVSGLAHFCEHLLFMGTEKYPEENEYSSYLSKHSGHSNAYTAAEHTNYYFELSSDYLEGALDRFSQFFISPLFSKSCKDREIKAVDSENKKNLQSDMWRLYQLDKLTSNPEHPYNGFSTGNYHTLHEEPVSQNRNVRDILIDFHKNNYSANLMSLVILGKEDLDTLSTWAIEMFSEVPNKSLPRPFYENVPLYTPDQLDKFIKAKPIMDTHRLELTFFIPDDQDSKWATKPSSYYSHLLGHESGGSLLSYMKKKSWVSELSAGGMKVCQGSFLFMIEFELTTLGLKNWEQIVLHIFEYINLLKKEGPKKWIWDEVNEMSEINFKFKQKREAASTVSKMSSTLYKFSSEGHIPPKYLLSSSIGREYSEDLINDFGKYLNPHNYRLTFTSQTLEGLSETEKWYGTNYSYENIPASLTQKILELSLNENFHLPIPNEYIPEDFTVHKKKLENPLTHPYLIEDSNKTHVWYKQDDQFLVPKGTIEMFLHLPNSNTDCKSSVYSSLLSLIISDELNEISYYASLVGLSFSCNHMRDGLTIKVSGYNDKLPILLKRIAEKINSLEPKEDRFNAIKDKFEQDMKNFGYSVPYSQIGTHFLILINDKTYSYEDKLKVVKQDVSFEEFVKFANTGIWDDGLFIEVLIQGNFTMENAKAIKDLIGKQFAGYKPLKGSVEEVLDIVKLSTYQLPEGSYTRYELPLVDEKNINSCIEYFIQISPSFKDNKLRVLTDLLSTMIHEPCFNELRTKEQLGYVVFSGTRLTRSSFGLRVLIQSERSTDYLEYRIEEFLEKFGKFVNKELTEENFLKFKKALKDKKLTKLKNLNEEVSRFWNCIIDGYFNFDSRIKHVELLENISLSDFIEFVNQYVLNKSTPKLVVHLKSQCTPLLPSAKLLHCAINNWLSRNEIKIDSDFVDLAIEKNLDDPKVLADVLIEEMSKTTTNTIPEDIRTILLQTIETGISTPVPESYPKGKLLEYPNQIRETFKRGDIPKPTQLLSTFYYSEQDLAHL